MSTALTEKAAAVEPVILAAVKWSDVDRMVLRHRDAFVEEFKRFKGCPLEDEYGEPIHLDNGRQAVVTVANFAERYGISTRSLGRWLSLNGETNAEHGAARHPKNNGQNGRSSLEPESNGQEPGEEPEPEIVDGEVVDDDAIEAGLTALENAVQEADLAGYEPERLSYFVEWIEAIGTKLRGRIEEAA